MATRPGGSIATPPATPGCTRYGSCCLLQASERRVVIRQSCQVWSGPLLARLPATGERGKSAMPDCGQWWSLIYPLIYTLQHSASIEALHRGRCGESVYRDSRENEMDGSLSCHEHLSWYTHLTKWKMMSCYINSKLPPTLQYLGIFLRIIIIINLVFTTKAPSARCRQQK